MRWFIKDKNQWQNFQNEILPVLKKDRSIRLTGQLSLLLLVFCFGLAIFTFGRLPAQVPLFYSLPWGEEQLAPKISLLILPLGIFFIAILNFSLIVVTFKNHFLAAKILTWLTFSLVFLTTIDLVKIILLIY